MKKSPNIMSAKIITRAERRSLPTEQMKKSAQKSGRGRTGGALRDLPCRECAFIALPLTVIQPSADALLGRPAEHVETIWSVFAPETPTSDPKPLRYHFDGIPMPLQPVLAQPGDVLFCHSLIPHAIERNCGPERPVVYYRLGNPEIRGLPALGNPWLNWF
jgi:hypothetical protein